jgi:hypothetical protein
VMTLDFGRHALSICAAAVLLAACGEQSVTTVPAVSGADKSLPYHYTFKYTGKKQLFLVPAGVTKIVVVALGAAGAGSSYRGSSGEPDFFGRGGRV